MADRNRNQDGSFRRDASARSLTPFYGEHVIRMLVELEDVVPSRWQWYSDLIKQQATIAARYGRKSLRQSHLR